MAQRPFVLRSLIHCGVCSRRMQGHWSHGSAYYRCRYPAEYALANRVAHPKNVFVREDEIVPALDGWLGQVLHPDRIEATCEALVAAQTSDAGEEARLAAARRTLAEDPDRRRTITPRRVHGFSGSAVSFGEEILYSELTGEDESTPPDLPPEEIAGGRPRWVRPATVPAQPPSSWTLDLRRARPIAAHGPGRGDPRGHRRPRGAGSQG